MDLQRLDDYTADLIIGGRPVFVSDLVGYAGNELVTTWLDAQQHVGSRFGIVPDPRFDTTKPDHSLVVGLADDLIPDAGPWAVALRRLRGRRLISEALCQRRGADDQGL